jgi:hypothetical protein
MHTVRSIAPLSPSPTVTDNPPRSEETYFGTLRVVDLQTESDHRSRHGVRYLGLRKNCE